VAKLRQFAGRPQIQDAVEQAKEKVADKLPSSGGVNSQETPSVAPIGNPHTGDAITAVAPIAP
jgi:hypothetical protein